jgi:L-seryl-tRNA(Ser) seleniumtransferase
VTSTTKYGTCADGPSGSYGGGVAELTDPRRLVPRTDAVLADPRLEGAVGRLGPALVKEAVTAAQDEVRAGSLSPGDLVGTVLARLPAVPATLRPVLNATGVLVHTNLGRAPLSVAARAAVLAAAGTTDVELDLATGRRGPRGAGALAALAAAVPDAGAVHVVNNGAAALVLAATALAAGREIVLARGELVEIGDGFRIPDLIVSTGARLREVGTTNRVTLADYAAAVGPETGFVLKVHPSNFVVSGFTSAVPAADLAGLDAPLVVDIGSGLLAPSPVLPAEPDAASALRAGAALVTASGDKLLGGPQAGLLLGRADLVSRLRRHPLARALRVDKLTLAALEATLRGPAVPVARFLAADPVALTARAQRLAALFRAARLDAVAVDSEAAVGGGGGPGVLLPSAAVSLPEAYADRLRTGDPAVLGRVAGGRCLLDLRAVEETDDRALQRAVLAAGAG